MGISKTHTDLAAARAGMLEDALASLFRGDTAPSAQLVRNIAVHLAIGKRPDMLQNPRAVKADPSRILDKYAPAPEVVHDSTAQSQVLCPISQSPVTVPWTSACGHTFEEHAVLAYMEMRRGQAGERRRKGAGSDAADAAVGCPVIGCGRPLARKEERA